MESELGKLFIGGISWDTDEDRLREYFKSFGEVVEAVIMKDRATGRARGFGFVVFADPSVAERVVMEKHLIDGRLVEAKKAVPRDDPHILNRCVGILPGSPGPGRTKKIFVGGLASTVTDSDFKKYFEQFGTITDVVVMYDHNTQRPRGFGFITFDSEDAVDKVLHKTFHELNGKMVEVKRAVPKELSPGPNVRLPIGGLNQQGLNRVNSFLNGYNPGFSQSSAGSFGMRMDGRFGQLPSARKMLPSFNPAYGVGMNFDSGTSLNYGGGSSGYGRALNQYYGASSHRFGSPMNPNLSFGSSARNIWTNGSLNYNAAPSNSSGSLAGFGSNSGLNWAGSSSPLATHGGGRDSSFGVGNSGYGIGETNFGLAMGGYGRSNGTAASVNSSFAAASNGYEGNYTDAYGGGSIYGDLTWQSGSTELDGSSPFAYGLGATRSDVMAKGSSGYMGGYNVANRQMNRDG